MNYNYLGLDKFFKSSTPLHIIFIVGKYQNVKQKKEKKSFFLHFKQWY